MILTLLRVLRLLTLLPPTLSAPTATAPTQDPEPYMGGYVLTAHNSSSYAGLFAVNLCMPIYYNASLPGYQDAFAYRLFGGCRCGFYV